MQENDWEAVMAQRQRLVGLLRQAKRRWHPLQRRKARRDLRIDFGIDVRK